MYTILKLKPPSHDEFLYTSQEVIASISENISALLDHIEKIESRLSRNPDSWMTVQRVEDTKRIVNMSKLFRTQHEAESCLTQWKAKIAAADKDQFFTELVTEFAVVGFHAIEVP